MVSCLMGDSTALASAIVRCCLKKALCGLKPARRLLLIKKVILNDGGWNNTNKIFHSGMKK